MNTNILVTGATGKVGEELVKILKENNVSFSIGSRHENKVKEQLGEQLNVVPFDFNNQQQLENGLANISDLFMVGPNLAIDGVKEILNVLTAAKKQGVKNIVFLSAKGANLNPESPQSKIESFIKENGFTYTILRPTFFMQNFNTVWIQGVLNGAIELPADDAKTAFIDTKDIAAVAALALTTNNHNNKEYNLTGPESLSHAEVAEIFTQVLEKNIGYTNLSPEEFGERLQSWGLSDYAVQTMGYLYDTVRNGYTADLTTDVETATGNKPSSFHQYVSTHKNIWLKGAANN